MTEQHIRFLAVSVKSINQIDLYIDLKKGDANFVSQPFFLATKLANRNLRTICEIQECL